MRQPTQVCFLAPILAVAGLLGVAEGLHLYAQEGGRTRVRALYTFEQGADASQLSRRTENLQITTVQDNGVTEGKNCARIVVPKGSAYGVFHLGAGAIRNWSEFDYFAMDLHTDDEHLYTIHFELWDGLTKNYATRCTLDQTTHPGKQTLLYPINRCKRNGKEGREWEELEPRDKIQMDGLTQVKIFLTPRKDRDAIFWIDNLRLMQEDAAKPKLRVPLPEGAIAFNFGSPGSTAPGFRTVSPRNLFKPGGFGFTAAEGLAHGGEGWPDLLAGTFVSGVEGKPFEFRAQVPSGAYHVWLCAGKIIRPALNEPRYLLRVNELALVDERPTLEEFHGEKYLYRFLSTPYSEKPHALWTSYLDRMYPVTTHALTIKDGTVTIQAVNHFLSAAILVPESKEKEFGQMVAAIREKRIEAFEKTYYQKPQKKPARLAGDGDYLCWVPDLGRGIQPSTGPTTEERKRGSIRAAGAPGQRLVLRVAVTPFVDLGRSSLVVGDLKGPGTIRASQIKGHFQNYHSNGADLSEMVLLPALTTGIEAGISQCFWLWLEIPADAPAGQYTGSFSFQPGQGKPTTMPVELEVYPFRLEEVLPVAYGMYYSGWDLLRFPEGVKRRLLREQLEFMRQVGFTSVSVPNPVVVGLKGDGKTVSMRFDTTAFDLAREVGMARHPDQALMGGTLGIGRAIGRRLPGSQGARVDQNPGIELRQPQFRGYFLDAARQYRDFIQKTGLPLAVEIVDEPREFPNPWNRNLADTIAYSDLLHEVKGLRTFVTPMGDTNNGKDYTVLVDHADIISVHAWKGSAKLMEKTQEQKKTLWIYNTGMDRFSWGFYAWRARAAGRWEWHFCFAEDGAKGGYPGREWYNPFTAQHGLAPLAPFTQYRGAMLYQSRFLDVCEGISDYAYLYTLRKAIEANRAANRNAEVVKEATAFLTALDRVIPATPDVKGIVGEAEGALVGLGIEDEARLKVEAWRRTIAEYLKVLKK